MQSCLCMGQVQYIQWQNKAVSTQQNQRSGWGLWGWNLQGTWNYYFLLHSELLKEQGNVWSLLNEFSFTVKSSVSQPIKTLSFAGFFSKSAIRWVFLLYKHQYSGLCFQPSWRLHLRQQRPGNSCLENSHFPPYLIHPQFTGNSHISCIWNLLKSVQIFLMRCSGAHFFRAPWMNCVEWWQQPPEGESQLSHLACFSAPLPGLCLQHTRHGLCCLLSPPSFFKEL